MTARDQTSGLRVKVVRANATREKTELAARNAHKAYRVALMRAVDGGVPKAELARDNGTSSSRVRQLVKQARAEAGA